MKKKLMAIILALGCLFAMPSNSYIEEIVMAAETEGLILFDQDGVKATLTGKTDDASNCAEIEVIVENSTDKFIEVSYSGTMNGWSITNNLLENIQANSKIKSHLWFMFDQFDISSSADVQTINLTYTVTDKDTHETLFEVNPGEINFQTLSYTSDENQSNENVDSTEPEGEGSSSGETVTREVTLPGHSYPTLSIGSNGEDTKALQQALIDQGFLDGGADGIYGNGTAAGVSAFQESAGLAVTGTADSQTQSKLFGDEEQTITITLTGTSETDYMKVDGIFMDESYVDEENDSMKLVYFCYTVSTNAENLQIDAKDSNLTIDGVNTYTSTHVPNACTYMGSYYYEDFLEDVYVGDSLKVVETFKIPNGDLTPGKTLTFSSSQIPDSDKISLLTDNIVPCSDSKTVAMAADPEGYADIEYKMTDATGDSLTSVKNELVSNYYDFSLPDLDNWYHLEFFDDNSYSLETTIGGQSIETSGTYSIKNGFVVLVNTIGSVSNIPYSWDGSKFDLDVFYGFDPRKY